MVYALDANGIPEPRTTHKPQRWEVRINGRPSGCRGWATWDKQDAVRELERLADPFWQMLSTVSLRDYFDREGNLCRVVVIGRESGFDLYVLEILEVE